MKTVVTVPKLKHHEDEVTVLNLNHHKDEITVPKAETNRIAVNEVVDTKNKERNERCSRKILATSVVALVVFVPAAITIAFYLGGNIRKCSVKSAWMTFKDVTGEIHTQKVTLSQTGEKYEIPGSDKVIVDFEKVLLVYRVENSSTPICFVTAFNTSGLESPDVMMAAVVFDKWVVSTGQQAGRRDGFKWRFTLKMAR